MEHSFDVVEANKYGIEEAILIKSLRFWIGKNKANGRHKHENRYWTYCSARTLHEQYPYISESKINRALNGLVKQGLIIKGNFNKVGYDRTTWYAFVEECDYLKMINEPKEQSDEPNTQEDSKDTSDNVEKIFNYWNSKKIIQHRKLTDRIRKKILARLKTFKVDEIKKAIDNYNFVLKSDKYFLTYHWTIIDFLNTDDKLDKWLSNNIIKSFYIEPKKKYKKPTTKVNLNTKKNTTFEQKAPPEEEFWLTKAIREGVVKPKTKKKDELPF